MLTVPQIRKMLADRNIKHVGRDCELHYNVVYRLSRGATANPSYATVRKLSDYLTGGPNG